MTRIHRRLSFANVVSLTALFVALSGSAYAAFSLPDGSVGTKQIKNQAVTLGKISKATRNALKGPRGLQGVQGMQGVPGLQGIQGLKGNTGAAGATNVTIRSGTATSLAFHTSGIATIRCNSNEVAVGGGGNLTPGAGAGDALVSSIPIATSGQTPDGWLVQGYNGSSAGGLNLTAYVVCAAP